MVRFIIALLIVHSKNTLFGGIYMWIIWTLVESGTKVLEKFVAKGVLGVSIDSAAAVFAVTLFIGSVQALSGAVSRIWVKDSLLSSSRNACFSMLFGLIAVTMQFTFILAYAKYGADLAIAALISSMSIIPSLAVDRLFGDKLRPRQYLGMLIFIFAVYSMLDFPTLDELFHLPVWVFIVAVNTLLSVANESISRSVRDMHALTKNFWAGASSLFVSVFALTILGEWGYYSTAKVDFYLGAIMLGFCSLGIVTFKLFSYKGDAGLMPKKLLLRGSNLVLAALIGYLFLGEGFSIGKSIGLMLFFIAFPLADKRNAR